MGERERGTFRLRRSACARARVSFVFCCCCAFFGTKVDFVLTAMTASTAPIMNKRQEPTPEIELEYAKLARYVGRLFYARKNQGLHCVLLNLLTEHEWIKEDMLAK